MEPGKQVRLEYWDTKNWLSGTYFGKLDNGGTTGPKFKGIVWMDVHFGRPQYSRVVDEESNYEGEKIIFRQSGDETKTFEFLVPDFMVPWMHFVVFHRYVLISVYDDYNEALKTEQTYGLQNVEFEEDTDRISGLKIGRFIFEVEPHIDAGCDSAPYVVEAC